MLQYFEPLLLCLEYTLKADSPKGGQWIWANQSSCYHFLHNPLTKLLPINDPSNFFTTSKQSESLSAGCHDLCIRQYDKLYKCTGICCQKWVALEIIESRCPWGLQQPRLVWSLKYRCQLASLAYQDIRGRIYGASTWMHTNFAWIPWRHCRSCTRIHWPEWGIT